MENIYLRLNGRLTTKTIGALGDLQLSAIGGTRHLAAKAAAESTKAGVRASVKAGNMLLNLLGAEVDLQLFTEEKDTPPFKQWESAMARAATELRQNPELTFAYADQWIKLARAHERADEAAPYKATRTYIDEVGHLLSRPQIGVPEDIISPTVIRLSDNMSDIERAEKDAEQRYGGITLSPMNHLPLP